MAGLRRKPVSRRLAAELPEVMVGLAEIVRKDGILALEGVTGAMVELSRWDECGFWT